MRRPSASLMALGTGRRQGCVQRRRKILEEGFRTLGDRGERAGGAVTGLPVLNSGSAPIGGAGGAQGVAHRPNEHFRERCGPSTDSAMALAMARGCARLASWLLARPLRHRPYDTEVDEGPTTPRWTRCGGHPELSFVRASEMTHSPDTDRGGGTALLAFRSSRGNDLPSVEIGSAPAPRGPGGMTMRAIRAASAALLGATALGWAAAPSRLPPTPKPRSTSPSVPRPSHRAGGWRSRRAAATPPPPHRQESSMP